MKKNIAIFASGRGSNFEAIAKAVKRGSLKTNLALVICDKSDALVLDKARKAKVKVELVERKCFGTRSEFENEIIQILKKNKVDLVVLAGFMRVLSSDFIKEYRNKIINIHPSLLPAFKGEHGIKDAFNYGVKVTGVTVHFVDEEMDHGPIILQKEIQVDKKDTLFSLEEKIHKLEHKLFPKAIDLFVKGKLKLEGRRVRII